MLRNNILWKPVFVFTGLFYKKTNSTETNVLNSMMVLCVPVGIAIALSYIL